MKIQLHAFRLRYLLLFGLPAFSCTSLRAGETGTTASVTLSAPGQPATLNIDVTEAEIELTGGDGDTITVTSTPNEKDAKKNHANGLRRLDDSDRFDLSENKNIVSLTITGDSKPTLKVLVPRAVSLDAKFKQGANLKVKNLTGDVSITNPNGNVLIEDSAGAAVVYTSNGQVSAHYSYAPTKLIALTSMNGAVDLRVPGDTKANVRLRTNGGAIFTDFDDTSLKTTKETEDPSDATRGNVLTLSIQQNGDYTSSDSTTPLSLDDITKLCADTIAKNKEAAIHFRSHENADPKRIADAMTACRQGGLTKIYLFTGLIPSKATEQETKKDSKEAVRLTRIADEIRARRAIRQSATTGSEPTIAVSSAPAAKGKIISGTLNGGGVDIKIATMNGKITLEKTKFRTVTSVSHSSRKDNITVTFQNPDKFTDAEEDFPGTTSTYYLDELRDCVQKTAAPLLPAGSTLTVTFLDIDLAGMIRPERNNVRFMTSTTIPRAQLSFQLIGADGQVLQEGERRLMDMNYQMSIGLIGRNEALYYDKQLLKDWIAKEFKPQS